MRLSEKWFTPVFLGIVVVAAVGAAACGNDPAHPVLLTSADSAAGDSTPGDTVPGDSVPPDSLPPDTLPAPRSASLTVTPASQERAVGDSGTVTATLRDSAGREIFPAAIEWDLSDTSSVVRIRTRTASYVVFNAVGRGRAVFIARFHDLADTALVFVR